MEHQEKKVPVMDLQKYAIVDASSLSETTRSMLKNLTERYGKNMVDGVVLSPHGEGKVVFIETLKKEGPIVEQINKLAEMYSLYPAYVVNEDKDHLPKFGKLPWYVVEAAIMLFDKPAGGLEEFKEKMSHVMKVIYRDDSTFVKAFVYEGNTYMHVVFFNSERSPKYRGKNLGVPQWRDEIERLKKEIQVPCSKSEFKVVRYANL